VSVVPEQLGFIPEDECHLERQVLRDPDLQRTFDDKGYVIVPLISDDDVARLREGYLRAAGSPEGVNPEGSYNDTYAEFSVIHSRPSFRQEAYELITSVLTPAADRYLSDYRPLVANFVNKPPGTGVVPAHQNWSVVDEASYQSVSVWVALVDCVLDNGTMLMCDGSHRMLRGRRGMWAYHQFSRIESSLIEQHLTPVDVRAGDAVILDDAVVHYSPPNATADPRLAIQFVMVPREADALFFQQVGTDGDTLDVDVWRVEPEFFFNFWHGDGDAEHGSVVARRSVPAPLLNDEQFDALMRRDFAPVRSESDVPPTDDSTATARADSGPSAWWRRLRGRAG
jgi:ectoine hydroxylase-related dioxygenase (phytanoyl-CoA dioxygenase family)